MKPGHGKPMNDVSDPIRIVCGIDTAYAPHLAAMLRSLMVSNPGEDIRVYVLHDSVDPKLRARAEACAPKLPIEWIEINDHRVLGFDRVQYLTRAAYLRLTMLEMLDPEIHRVLYLDSDIIVNGKLRPLWQTDLGDKPCGAVIDPGVKLDEFISRWSLSPGDYFNSGMMLCDLDRMREAGCLQRAMDILAKSNDQCIHADQCALNVVLWNNWHSLDPIWNFQRVFLRDYCAPWKAMSSATQEPVIFHYSENYKPWQNADWHPYAWLYMRNLLRTPFWPQVLRDGNIGPIKFSKIWLRYHIKRPRLVANNKKRAAA